MKLLNLDSLAKPKRTLRLGGVDYAVNGMTVENFIETSRIAEKMASDAPLSEQISEAIEMILRAIPSMQRETLQKLDFEVINVIIDFVRDDPTVGETVTEGNVQAA